MRSVSTIVTTGTLALLLIGCGDSSSSGGGMGATASESVEQVGELDGGIAIEVDVPTQDEADVEAAEAIDEANADAEFEALQREVDQDQG
jgi:hypothetical protein